MALTVLFLVGCTSGSVDPDLAAGLNDDAASGDGATVDPPAADASPAPADGCARTASAIVDRFERFLEPYADLSPIQFLSLDDPIGVDEFRSDVGAEVAAGVDAGCDAAALDPALQNALGRLNGQSPLVDFLAASVIGPGPAPSEEPVEAQRELTVTPGDDLAVAVASLAPDATLTLAAGVYTLDTPLVTNSTLTIVGAGMAETIIRSSARDAAIAVADGSLELQNLAVEHVDDSSAASVVISFARPLRLASVILTGAATDSDGGGGTGLVVADAVSIADRVTALAGAEITIVDSELVGNEIAGAAISADVVVAITGSRFGDNGVCGLCLFDTVTGAVAENTLDGNTIGLQLSDSAAPEVVGNTVIENSGVGIVVGDSAAPMISDNRIDENAEAGIEVQDTSSPTIRENSIGSHPAAIVVNGEATPAIAANTIDGAEVGIQIGAHAAATVSGNRLGNVGAGLVAAGETTATFIGNEIDGGGIGIEANGTAAPTFEDNRVTDVTTAGLVYLDQSSGIARQNSFTGAMTVGIQVGGQAQPLLDDLTVTYVPDADEGQTTPEGRAPPVGMLLAEQSSPQVTNSQVSDFLIGIQISGAAAPTVSTTVVDGGSLDSVGLLYGEASSGVAFENDLRSHLIGVQVGGDAAPTLEANNVDDATQAAYLLTGSATPTLDGNQCSGVVPGVVLLESATPTLLDNPCPIEAG